MTLPALRWTPPAWRWQAGLHGAAPLPAHRGEEIAPDVLEAHADEIFDEAENRIYVEKAVLAVLLAGNKTLQ
ncbi:MAG: hypothetical protein ACLURG_08605 [Gemmiger sp.]